MLTVLSALGAHQFTCQSLGGGSERVFFEGSFIQVNWCLCSLSLSVPIFSQLQTVIHTRSDLTISTKAVSKTAGKHVYSRRQKTEIPKKDTPK